jgi:hypothetical protein
MKFLATTAEHVGANSKSRATLSPFPESSGFTSLKVRLQRRNEALNRHPGPLHNTTSRDLTGAARPQGRVYSTENMHFFNPLLAPPPSLPRPLPNRANRLKPNSPPPCDLFVRFFGVPPVRRVS